MMTSTLELVPEAVDRFQILPSGVRIARLAEGDDAWIVEYEKILKIAAQDFLRRAHQTGTVEGVLEDLSRALAQAHQAVWFVLRQDYRLLGFALAELVREFGAPPRAYVQAAYLYPRLTPRSVLPALTRAIIAWAAAQGATTLGFQTRRQADRAWQRVGATRAATVYTMPIETGETGV
jgi:hypothetical protein